MNDASLDRRVFLVWREEDVAVIWVDQVFVIGDELEGLGFEVQVWVL
jgi:hypothetical protein